MFFKRGVMNFKFVEDNGSILGTMLHDCDRLSVCIRNNMEENTDWCEIEVKKNERLLTMSGDCFFLGQQDVFFSIQNRHVV